MDEAGGEPRSRAHAEGRGRRAHVQDAAPEIRASGGESPDRAAGRPGGSPGSCRSWNKVLWGRRDDGALVEQRPQRVKFAAHVGTVQEVSTYLNDGEQAIYYRSPWGLAQASGHICDGAEEGDNPCVL